MAFDIIKGQQVSGQDAEGTEQIGSVVRVMNRTDGVCRVDIGQDDPITLTGCIPTDDLADDLDAIVVPLATLDIPDGVTLPDGMTELAPGDMVETIHTMSDGTVRFYDIHHADGSRTTVRGDDVRHLPSVHGVAPNGVVRGQALGTKGVQGSPVIPRVDVNGDPLVWDGGRSPVVPEDTSGNWACALCGAVLPVTAFPTVSASPWRLDIPRGKGRNGPPCCGGNAAELAARGSSRDVTALVR
jgi:hypothetical protein